MVGWVVGYVYDVSGIGSCVFVYSAWGLSSSVGSKDFGCCFLSGWMCGLITGFGAFGEGVDAEVVIVT
jgi:hypothetical protein